MSTSKSARDCGSSEPSRHPFVSDTPAHRRRGRSKSQKSLDLVSTAAEILQEIQPASVRGVCYRLFVAGLIPDMSKNSTGKVSKQLVWAREQGVIPWEWIVDETRKAERVNAWDSIDDLITSAVTQYRRDNWREQPNRVEVWSEKGTVRGILAPVLNEFGVTFQAVHGFAGATTMWDVSQSSVREDKPFTILYVGDYDPSGLCMSEVDLPQRLARYGARVTLRRIALTADDVAPGTTLPHFEAATKKGDSRYKWFVAQYGSKCWELDALSPVVLRERVKQAIVDLIDVDVWNRDLLTEQAEVESMDQYVAGLKKSISSLGANCSGGAS
jgi:hypothetical protein